MLQNNNQFEHLYTRSLELLHVVFPTGAHELLPSIGRNFSWKRFDLPSGEDGIAVAQRVMLGRPNVDVMHRLRSDFLTAISEFAGGRGMQLGGTAVWVKRDDQSTADLPLTTHLDYEMMRETPHFFVAPIEVFGFLLPEKPSAQGRIRKWFRPLFHIISGRELYAKSWLTAPDEQVLFTHGYLFLQGKVRPNPYPYGPGAFDIGVKQFEFVRLDDDTIEARMLAIMTPSISRRLGGKLGAWQWLDGVSLAHHARIHAQMIRNVAL